MSTKADLTFEPAAEKALRIEVNENMTNHSLFCIPHPKECRRHSSVRMGF
jgi:hypothetical protein